MSLDRKQILDEMGLSPQWIRRDQPAVARVTRSAARPAEPLAAPVMPKAEEFLAAVACPTPLAAGQRLGKIAEQGWDSLRRSIAACRACALCGERQQAVPGVGDENADWLFIGEGPGAEEDAQGEPFVGAAGKLLDAMLAAIDLERGDDVYIANAVKCRPPSNRTPEAGEIAACVPYLKRQIALLQPRLIVLLGRSAVQALLGEEGSLASLRGKPFAYRDGDREIPVVVTYHPAYLLRALPDKAKSWEDLCRARALMRVAKGREVG